MAYLVTDFGASRIKTGIYDNGELSLLLSRPALGASVFDNNKFEVELSKIKEVFDNIIKDYSKFDIEGVFICSEMHGFCLVDENNKPLSNYISWKDERVKDIPKIQNFFEKTGMKQKPCYPFFKVKSVMDELNIKKAKVITLPEFLCTICNNSTNLAHISLSCGLGFYNLRKKRWDEELAGYYKDIELLFNEVTEKIKIGGYYVLNNKKIPIYCAVGDLQSAIYGSTHGEDTVNLNLGTGSQVVTIGIKNENEDLRPFFDNKILNVITHIPSGRALNVYVNFLKNINPKVDYWEKIANLTLNDLKKADLTFDLGVFESAWGYKGQGKIEGIFENNFNIDNYLSSLILSYLKQYDKALELLTNKKPFSKIVLSGGIAGKIPVIEQYFKNNYQKEVYVENGKTDETLKGLVKLIEKAKKEA